jgi:hypothetical protein
VNIPKKDLEDRAREVEALGPCLILESRPNAWWGGGKEFKIISRDGRVTMEMIDWDEGTGCTFDLTGDQRRALLELLGDSEESK